MGKPYQPKQTAEESYPGCQLRWSDQMIVVMCHHTANGVDATRVASILNQRFPNLVRPFTKNIVVGKLWRLRKAEEKTACLMGRSTK